MAVEELEAFFAVLLVFLAGELDDEDDFFAVLVFLAVEPVEDDVFLAVEPPAAFFAATAVFCTAAGVALSTAARVSLGSFFAPETTSLSWAPALKFGTAFFFDFIRAPVEGLRTQRASRTFFSKEPKPVMATFSPLATSRVMVSSTESSACAAAFRLPSKRAARVSIS